MRLQLARVIRFNPRSHMRSDAQEVFHQQRGDVSIHAPTWGATYANANNASSNSFQSTLPHGERQASAAFSIGFSCFNPRSHMGSDVIEEIIERSNLEVSIHAPAWGATPKRLKQNGVLSEFQSTLPHGERRELRQKQYRNHMFQSTLPHGERPLPNVSDLMVVSFQSTLPHGERREYE